MGNDTRQQSRTQTGTVDMNDGSNAGKEVATQTRSTPRENAVERSIREARQFRDQLVAQVQATRPTIESFLRVHGVDWEFFVSNLLVGLEGTMKNDRDFFDPQQGVTVGSFIDAVVRASKDGLAPDGKKGAIVRFKRVAQWMPMVEGFCDILYATGFVKAINHNVVRDCDEIDYMEGDQGYVRQKKPFKRPATAETIGAWCVIELTTGGKIVELCDDKDLADIAKVSRATKGPRADWADEMHRKGPFRRAMKRAPKDARLSQVLKHDDDNYDLTVRLNADERRAPPPPAAALLDDRAHHVGDHDDQTDHDERDARGHEDAGDAGGGQGPEAGDQASDPSFSAERSAAILRHLKAISEADSGIALGAVTQLMDKDPALADATTDERQRLVTAIEKKRDELASAEPEQLFATITKADGRQAFEDPREWEVEIVTKLGQLEGKALKAFWLTNVPDIQAALESHPDHAGRVLERAEMAGLGIEG